MNSTKPVWFWIPLSVAAGSVAFIGVEYTLAHRSVILAVAVLLVAAVGICAIERRKKLRLRSEAKSTERAERIRDRSSRAKSHDFWASLIEWRDGSFLRQLFMIFLMLCSILAVAVFVRA